MTANLKNLPTNANVEYKKAAKGTRNLMEELKEILGEMDEGNSKSTVYNWETVGTQIHVNCILSDLIDQLKGTGEYAK